MTAKIGGLGEIALQVSDLDIMQAFYENVIGLELMKRFDTSAFFRIADGYNGHVQILALFDRATQPNAKQTTLDHFAFTIDLADFEPERTRLETHGLDVHTTTHAWVQWRSLYVRDPEGNTLELVCFDPSIEKE